MFLYGRGETGITVFFVFSDFTKANSDSYSAASVSCIFSFLGFFRWLLLRMDLILYFSLQSERTWPFLLHLKQRG